MALEEVYIGIDLEESRMQVSYFTIDMDAPQTVSLVAGEELYRIPLVLRRSQESGSWYLGDGKMQEGELYVDRLWERCLKGERLGTGREYGAVELFSILLRKVLRMVPGLTELACIRSLTFHLQKIEFSSVQLLKWVGEGLGILPERIFIQDDAESFCHFAMNQEKELKQHDVVLFSCEENELSCYYLKEGEKTSPKRVDIEKIDLGILPGEPQARDMAFGKLAGDFFRGKLVSSVYLMGDGLEGGWLKESLHIICRGRRAFQGKNLFANGACYGSFMQMHKEECGYVFFSDYKLANNVFLKVKNKDRSFFWDLAEAGTSCYEVNGSCQVLLSGDASVDVWLKAPDSGQARIESLQLPDLPERPDKATRLLIEVLPSEKRQLRIRVTDKGLGGWYASSGKVWEYCINE